MAHGPSCMTLFMNMHEIRYDIPLLPLIILSSDLCSIKLQPVAPHSESSLEEREGGEEKKKKGMPFFIGIKCLKILAGGCQESKGRERKRERRTQGQRDEKSSMNALAC